MTTTLLSDIQHAFKALNDPVQAQQMKAYMLNQFEFMGIRATPRRQVLKAVLKKWPKSDVTREVVLNLAPPLWKLPEREFQYAAIDLLAWHHKSLGMKDLPALLKLVQSKSWWDTVDGLSGVIGDLLLQTKQQDPDVQAAMDDCLVHPNLWVRRVAMIHQLGWKTQTDEERLLAYAVTLAPETGFFIRKAIGWALRDHARTRPQAVRSFLKKHGSLLSGLSLREAGKHL
jgi:3-methyladenine DNA glycosylase AlkD